MYKLKEVIHDWSVRSGGLSDYFVMLFIVVVICIILGLFQQYYQKKGYEEGYKDGYEYALYEYGIDE